MSSPPRVPRSATYAGLTGVIAAIVGTFAPWVSSGRNSYNLYAATGVGERLGIIDNPAVSRLLPWLTLALLIPVALGALRLDRTAAWLGMVVGAGTGALAVVVLTTLPGHTAVGVGLDPTGPVTVLAGSALLLAAGVLVLVRGDPHRMTHTV